MIWSAMAFDDLPKKGLENDTVLTARLVVLSSLLLAAFAALRRLCGNRLPGEDKLKEGGDFVAEQAGLMAKGDIAAPAGACTNGVSAATGCVTPRREIDDAEAARPQPQPTGMQKMLGCCAPKKDRPNSS